MRIKPFLVALLILVAVAGTIFGVKALQIGKLISLGQEGRVEAPEVVSTTPVVIARWPRSIESVGSLRAVQGAELSTESSGVVTRILFENGQEVSAGELLLELDTQSEQANLRSSEAEADLARTIYERTRQLRANNTVPQSELDVAEAELRKMTALVEQLRADIRKKQLRAPFDGRLGIREVNLGQFLDAGAKIVALQALDPIFIDFLLPQQLLSVVKAGLPLEIMTDVYPGEVFAGELTAVNTQVDPVTRNIRLQGTLDNADGRLRPGIFGRVALRLGEDEELLAIPATALLSAPYGDSVFVIAEEADEAGEARLVARQRFIRTGRTQGDFVAVVEGLKDGETVVSSGAFKLRNGVPVAINNELAPQPQLRPEPEDA